MSAEDLKSRCLLAAKSAREGLDWVLDSSNAETVGTEKKSLVKELRRDERRARQMADAAERPMSVGVYGPSQAGKSYLVSVLAKPREGRLVAAVGDGMDFIEEINPEGDKEATGLVTRFTMRSEDCPPGYPVTLKILSEADIIRILANAFFRDGDNTEASPSAETLRERIDAGRAAMGSTETGGLTEGDLWDIQSYFETNFRGLSYAQDLAGLWDDAAEILPYLDLAARKPLVSLLWGEYEAFTEIYEQLVGALGKLGHPDKAYAGIESLQPRTSSIIDVATLSGLDGKGAVDDVNLRSEKGVECALPRPVVTALVAELVLPIVERPWDFFDNADLLDFPGVRERNTAKKAGGLEAYFKHSEAPRQELFLRGKVGFLYDRYVAQQDLTAMLLCVPPSNINVAADLSQGIEEWLMRTQGATAEERAQVDTMLFLVLTMFDRHLADPAGSLDPKQRFENRMEASLIAPFGGIKESWPLNWTPDKPFRNSFWLRNPNYPAEHVIKYENGREVEFLDHKVERLAELKAGSLSSDLVRRHFVDSDMAWEAAMTLNDGGVTHLAGSVGRVATSDSKERQIEARLRELSQKVARSLRPFFSDSDIDKRLNARRAVASSVLKELRVAFDNNRFGMVVEELGLPAEGLVWRMERTPENIRIISGEVEEEGDPWDEFEFEGVEAPADSGPAEEEEEEEAVRTMTLEQYQAESAIESWHDHMRSVSERPGLKSTIRISPSAAGEIATELMGAARRLDLTGVISRELKPWNDMQCGPVTAAALTAVRINKMVETLGVDLMEPDKRPTLTSKKTGESRQVFNPGAVRHDAMDLPEATVRRNRVYFQDWTMTLYRLFEDNARSEDGSMINIEENNRLGRILDNLDGLS